MSAVETVEETITTPLSLTQEAADVVKDLIAQQERDDLALRVYVAGGGCSGLQYGMALDENIEQDDQVFESLGVRMVVDPVSLRYIVGSTVEYVASGMGGGFKVSNPNATGGCGCGSSFSAEGEEGGSSCGSGCGCH
ncbi:MAG: iron-sulfur cluster insertion protein ErpA [Capsulimonadaceae bacterium]|nr:iron-sulfur cluster insertion protein ErpA [Capsulimonadaceae bacterium]